MTKVMMRYRCVYNESVAQLFYLDELPASEELPLSLSLMRLTIASDEELPAQARGVMERARAGDESNLSVSEIMDMVATIATYKFVNLSRAEIEAMMGINLEDTRIYREAREDEGRSLVLLLLDRRVGTLPEAIQTQVEALPLEQLEALGEDLLDFTNLTDLENWLVR
jgi:predicted transposase YdaD